MYKDERTVITGTITGYSRSKTTEEKEREKLKYWSDFWNKRNQVKATCCSF